MGAPALLGNARVIGTASEGRFPDTRLRQAGAVALPLRPAAQSNHPFRQNRTIIPKPTAPIAPRHT